MWAGVRSSETGDGINSCGAWRAAVFRLFYVGNKVISAQTGRVVVDMRQPGLLMLGSHYAVAPTKSGVGSGRAGNASGPLLGLVTFVADKPADTHYEVAKIAGDGGETWRHRRGMTRRRKRVFRLIGSRGRCGRLDGNLMDWRRSARFKQTNKSKQTNNTK